MSSAAWKASVTDGRKKAKIEISQDQDTTTTLIFQSSEHLDKLIHDLARVRAEMDPPVPSIPTEATISIEARSATFVAKADRQYGMRPLLFKHSGFGWIGFLFDDESAALMAASLTRQPA